MILIPSVKHTGTRFLREHLLEGHEYINRHVGEKRIDQLDVDGDLIIPLRRLDRIIVSWERRQLELPDLRSALTELVCRYDHQQPYYLPIDSHHRSDYLDDINEGLGLNLVTNWPVLYSTKGSSASNWDDITDKDYAWQLTYDFQSFFTRFYRA